MKLIQRFQISMVAAEKAPLHLVLFGRYREQANDLSIQRMSYRIKQNTRWVVPSVGPRR